MIAISPLNHEADLKSAALRASKAKKSSRRLLMIAGAAGVSALQIL